MTVSTWRLRDLAEDARREVARAQIDVAGLVARADRLASAAVSFTKPWGEYEGRHSLPAALSRSQSEALREALGAATALQRALDAVPQRPAVLDPLARRAAELAADLEKIERREDSSWVYWYEVRGRAAFLSATPVDVAPLLRERVFSRLSGSVLCSATLAVNGNLAHVRARVGLHAASASSPRASGADEVRAAPTRREVENTRDRAVRCGEK